MSYSRFTESPCIACGYLLDCATCVGEEHVMPSPGDATICIRCGHVMAFGDNLVLRDLTNDEMYAIAGDKRLLAAQRAIAAAKKAVPDA